MDVQNPPALELKPCPFCGGAPLEKIQRTRFGEAYAECSCCEARGPVSWNDGFAAWNRRDTAKVQS